MNPHQSPYADILESVQESPDLAEVGRIATVIGSYRDSGLGPWFREAIRSRYREFSRPGLPDGPRNNRLHLVR
jgi:hypothetical protein